MPPSDLLTRLQAGETPMQVGQALGLPAAEYAEAVGRCVLDPDEPANWPGLVQGKPRHKWLEGRLGESTWTELFPNAPRPARLALAAGLLQIHDFWESSHVAAQQADDLGEREFAAYWHAIAHRREPDPGNSAYWFRRVGRHPVFVRLAAEARDVVDAHPDRAEAGRAADGLLKGGVWNPLAFVDYCASASASASAGARRASDHTTLALKLQQIEMTALLEATLAPFR
jgi:hypothetical protein